MENENKIYGYIRVSRNKQVVDRQIDSLAEYERKQDINIHKTFTDYYTGKRFDRPEYIEMKSNMVRGDTLIIKELDRLGRNWDAIKDEWKWFMDNDVNIIVIDQPFISSAVDSQSIDQKLIKNILFEMLCYNAQKEVENRSRLTKEGLRAKKERGVKLGKQANEKLNQRILNDLRQGINKSAVAKTHNVSRQHIYNLLNAN